MEARRKSWRGVGVCHHGWGAAWDASSHIVVPDFKLLLSF